MNNSWQLGTCTVNAILYWLGNRQREWYQPTVMLLTKWPYSVPTIYSHQYTGERMLWDAVGSGKYGHILFHIK